jgi:YHS domain-containing protein
MKRFRHSITGVSVAAVIVLAALSKPVLLAQSNEPNEAKVSESAKVNVDGNGIILKGCDTVGYFEQGKPIKGDSALTSTYRGATYLFASASNKAEFDKDPAKYAPQYGGYCAYGVLKGALDDFEGLGDFVIYKGKLYLNATRARWRFLRLVSTATSRRQTRTGDG